MRYPEFLKNGGTIGFVAPSFGCATQPYKAAFENAISEFSKMNYKIQLGPNCFASEGIGISNTPQKCAKELQDMYADNANDVLISCGGGELMCEILPYLDFDKLKKDKAKWFLGYSDNTNFTFLQTILCDTAAIYGPCAASFGMKPWHRAIKDTFALLTGEKTSFDGYELWEKDSLKNEENPYAPYNTTEKTTVSVYNSNSYVDGSQQSADFKGRLIGGCMDCLVNFTGTVFDRVEEFNEQYKNDGIIWFLESCDLNVMSIRRALWNMDQAGWFKNLKGFIIGRPLIYGQNMMGLDHYEAVMSVIRKYNVPVIMDADIGHLPPSVPIVSGAVAHVKAMDGRWNISYEFN